MISVVIPTKDRRDALERTLAALAAQRDADFEVVVADNGSSDGSSELVARLAQDSPFALRLVNEPKPGPAAARNRAVEASSGDVLLFLGDDTEPTDAGFVGRHAARHAERPHETYGVLGLIVWSSRIEVTPFMRWLEDAGRQFGYVHLEPGLVSPARHFYTSNVSIKRRAFERAGRFDEAFPFAAVEDIELGVRLAAIGVQLEYDPAIVAWHDHPTTLADSVRRLVRVGQSARLYNDLHPDEPMAELPVPRRARVVRALKPAMTAAARLGRPRRLRDLAWTLLHSDAYAEGYARGV